MLLEKFTTYCLSKSGTSEDFPGKGQAVWMKAGGKMFAMTNVEPMKMDGEEVLPFHFINLKCDPERAMALRSQYAAIMPGWHQNKTHWNTLLMGQDLPDSLIYELTDHSYDLAIAALSKVDREGLGQ